MAEIITVISAVAVLATVGGYEQDMFGFGGFILRFRAFALATYIAGKIAVKKKGR